MMLPFILDENAIDSKVKNEKALSPNRHSSNSKPCQDSAQQVAVTRPIKLISTLTSPINKQAILSQDYPPNSSSFNVKESSVQFENSPTATAYSDGLLNP